MEDQPRVENSEPKLNYRDNEIARHADALIRLCRLKRALGEESYGFVKAADNIANLHCLMAAIMESWQDGFAFNVSAVTGAHSRYDQYDVTITWVDRPAGALPKNFEETMKKSLFGARYPDAV